MISQTYAIARNTFFESIRQPIMLVVLVIATIAIILSNPLSAFTMEDDQRMLIDMGLATVFTCSALLAAFLSTNVLGREIENRTALTVISKPIARPWFVLGKYVGVAAAITVGTAYMSFVFLIVEQHTVLQTVRDPIHLPAILFGVGAAIIGTAVAVWCNYFYNKVFASTVICVTVPLLGVAYLLTLMFRHDFSWRPISESFDSRFWLAIVAMQMGVLVLTSVAIAASTRLGQVLTLTVTVGVFMLGMLSDWIFGRHIRAINERWLDVASARGLTETEERVRTITMVSGEVEQIVERVEVPTVALAELATWPERLDLLLTWICYAIVPNFQAFWLTDALTQGHVIPGGYVVRVMLYGLAYLVLALAFATILFQRREVG